MTATRPYVDAFADAMEAKLAENRDKGDREGWKDEPAHLLIANLLDEVDELLTTLIVEDRQDLSIYGARLMLAGAAEQLRVFGPFAKVRGTTETIGECGDVANFAMMIADVAGGLEPRNSGHER